MVSIGVLKHTLAYGIYDPPSNINVVALFDGRPLGSYFVARDALVPHFLNKDE
jgi:hypothetical protein